MGLAPGFTAVSVCIALGSVNPLYFSFEDREIVATFVEVFVSSLERKLKVSSEEHMPRKRRARLNGIAR